MPAYDVAGVQSLEDDEDAVGVLRLDPDAVVLTREHPDVLHAIGCIAGYADSSGARPGYGT